MITQMAGLYKALALVALSFLAVVSESVSAPTAAFSPGVTNPVANAPIRFVDASAGGPTSWSWDFGDGTTSSSRSPVHTYANHGGYLVTLTVAGPRGSATTSQMVSVSAANTLTLNSAHTFNVTLSATDQRAGRTGEGQAIPQSDIFGYFSIPAVTGNAANPEVFVKIVDASGTGQGYWVFYGGMTDLDYTLSVTENATGRVKRYHKAAGSSGGGFDTSGFDSPQSGPAESAPCSSIVPELGDQVKTSSPEHALTLNSEHSFDVSLDVLDQRTGQTGESQPIPQNDMFGYFSIPAVTGKAANPKVFVKIVDASEIGLGYWVFYGGLPDLDYTLSVKENATGRVKSYHKPAGNACGGHDAFRAFESFAAVNPPPRAGLVRPVPFRPTVGPPPPPPPSPTPTPTGQASSTRIVYIGKGGDFFSDTVSGTTTTTIHVGDTVQWQFKSENSLHSTTSGVCKPGGYYDPTFCTADGKWDSGPQTSLSSPSPYSYRFVALGTYPYYCMYHGAMGMTGVVQVNP